MVNIDNGFKHIILNNTGLIAFCKKNDISFKLLKKCHIEKVSDIFVFTLQPISNDTKTSYDIVLKLDCTDWDAKVITTKNTCRLTEDKVV